MGRSTRASTEKRSSNRKSKIGSSESKTEAATELEENLKPVAASSPKNVKNIDPKDESVINMAREKLEIMKKEVTRVWRLQKFRIGMELSQRPFTKEIFAKNTYDCHLNSMQNKNKTQISGISTMSSTNFASSTRNFNQDKNSSSEIRNLRKFNLKYHGKKEVSFKENTTFEIRKSRRLLGYQTESQIKKDVTKSGESSSSSTSRNSKASKKIGSRAVALVTPGPEVNKPMSVLRRPTAGELAVSLFGSPLLVAPDYAPTIMPQINLPTADGKVVAILPRDGFTVDDLPTIATPTRLQLKTLNKYLNDVCYNR